MRSLLATCLACLAGLYGTLAHAQVYLYDGLGRLQAANYLDGSSIRYEYDTNGNVTRIRYQPAVTALPPDGVIDEPAENVSIESGQSVTFEGSGTDPDGAVPLAYAWDFDGGAPNSSDEDPGEVTFDSAGTFVVRLVVTDTTGLSDPTPDSVVVTVTDPPAGGGGSGGGSSGGGGSLVWLPLILGLFVLARARRAFVPALLVAAGAANAQSWVPMTSGTTEDLNDVWMHSPTLAYAVGDAGTVLQYDGTSWQPLDLGTTSNLLAVWGTGPNDVFVAGIGIVLRYDGVQWAVSTTDVGTVNDIWTAGPAAPVYAVGVRGAWRLTNGAWERMLVDPPNGSSTREPEVNITAVRGFNGTIIATANDDFGLASALLVYEEPEGSNPDTNRFDTISSWHGNDVVTFDDRNVVTAGEQSRRIVNADPADFRNWETLGFGLTALWGTAHDNLWSINRIGTSSEIRYRFEVGDTDPANLPDSERQLLVSFRQLLAIHGSDAGNVMAVGAQGIIYAHLEPAGRETAAQIPYSGYTESNVNTYTGEVVYETTDFRLDTRMPMEFRRYYAGFLREQGTVGGGLSDNWTHNYEWRVDELSEGATDYVQVTDYRGREYLFEVVGDSYVYASTDWANVGLRRFNNQYVLFDRDTGLQYTFNGTDLGSIEDRNGNRHRLLYSSGLLVGVTDDASGLISFEYGANSRIERVFVEKSTRLETVFGYESGVMTTATSPSGVVTRYSYEDGRYLTSIEIGSGSDDAYVEKTWEYDNEDRVAASVLTGGGRFEYNYGGDTTTITQPDGSTRTHSFDLLGSLEASTSALGAVTQYEYDDLQRLTAIVDPLGRTTRLAYDATSGLLSSVIEPGGFETTYTYAPESIDDGADFYDLDTVTRPNGALLVYGFDDRGNNDFVIDELTNIWTFDYDTAGDLVRTENPAGGVTTYDYFFDGQVRSITEPNGNQRLFSYDEFLRLEIETYGRSSNYEYSTRFVPDRIRDRSGTVLDYTFNAAGLVSRIDRSDGYYEEYRYDDAGRLGSIRRPGLFAIWSFRYDDFGRVSEVNRYLRESRYNYDSDGRLIEYRDFDDQSWLMGYTADGELERLTRPSGIEIDFEHADLRGYLSAVQNGLERFGISYDALGDVESMTSARERASAWERNLRGDVTRITDSASGGERLFASDVFGNITSYTDPLGGVREFDFGDDGLLESSTDAVENTSVYERDNEGRVSRITYADGTIVEFNYDTSGLISEMVGNEGSSVEIESTNEGRIIGGTDLEIDYTDTGGVSNSNGIEIQYNDEDRISRVVFAPGRYVDYEYNGRGKVVRVMDWNGAETTITRTDTGKVDVLTFPNGIVTDYDYDRADRILEIDMGTIGEILVSRDVFGRIESIDKESLNIAVEMPDEDRNFAYNLASQIEAGVYDARGNLILRDGDRPSFDAFGRMDAIEEGPEQTVISYDALGGITRVAQSSEEGVYVQNYAYRKPRISVERDSAGNDIWYYVHTVSGRLLYRINPDGARQFYHFDQDGNTILLTGDSGAVRQSYVYAPHGECIAQNGNIDNPKTTAAENGGFSLGDYLKLGEAVIDMESAHLVSGSIVPDATSETPPADSKPLGRSLPPGEPLEQSLERGYRYDTDVVIDGRPVINSWKLAETSSDWSSNWYQLPESGPELESSPGAPLFGQDPLQLGGKPFMQRFAESFIEAAIRELAADAVTTTAYRLSGIRAARPTDDATQPLPGEQKVNLGTAALFVAILYVFTDDFDEDNKRNGITDIKPPGWKPAEEQTPAVDSILKEVGVTLVPN